MKHTFIFSKTFFFFLSTCVWHNRLSCGTLICLLSVGNSFKTSVISVELGKNVSNAFHVQQIHSNFKPSCQIDRKHFKVLQNKF